MMESPKTLKMAVINHPVIKGRKIERIEWSRDERETVHDMSYIYKLYEPGDWEYLRVTVTDGNSYSFRKHEPTGTIYFDGQ